MRIFMIVLLGLLVTGLTVAGESQPAPKGGGGPTLELIHTFKTDESMIDVLFTNTGTVFARGLGKRVFYYDPATDTELVIPAPAVSRPMTENFILSPNRAFLSADWVDINAGNIQTSVYDAQTGAEILPMRQPLRYAPNWSPDSSMLVTAEAHDHVTIVSVPDGKALAHIPGKGQMSLYGMSVFSPDSHYFFSAQEPPFVLFEKGVGVTEVRLPVTWIGHSSFTKDGHLIVAGSVSGGIDSPWKILSVNVRTLKVERQWDLPEFVTGFHLSPSERYLGVGVWSGAGEVIDLQTGDVALTLKRNDMVFDFVFSPDERWMVVNNRGDFDTLLQVGSWMQLYTLQTTHEARANFRFIPDSSGFVVNGELLHVGMPSQPIGEGFDVQTVPNLKYISTIHPASFSRDLRYLALPHWGGASIIDLKAAAVATEIVSDTQSRGIVFSEDGNYLSTMWDGGTAQLYRLRFNPLPRPPGTEEVLDITNGHGTDLKHKPRSRMRKSRTSGANRSAGWQQLAFT